MPTATIVFPIAGAALDPTNPPALEYENGKPQLLFDAATDEIIRFSFRMPSAYLSDPVLVLGYKMASATSGAVVLVCEVMAVTPNVNEAVDTDSYDTPNTVTDTVPGTAGDLAEIPIPLANDDSLAEKDYVTLKVSRDANNAADTATGDLELVEASLEYTVTL